jgi:hypothetical protein
LVGRRVVTTDLGPVLGNWSSSDDEEQPQLPTDEADSDDDDPLVSNNNNYFKTSGLSVTNENGELPTTEKFVQYSKSVQSHTSTNNINIAASSRETRGKGLATLAR